MRKHIVMMTSSFILGSSMNASPGANGEHYFRPAFHKELKRVKSVGFGTFTHPNPVCKKDRKAGKKLIFIDWRRLYWGKLSDLVCSQEELHGDDSHQDGSHRDDPYHNSTREIVHNQEQDMILNDTQDALEFARELRQELKSFARHYGFQIVWRKKPSSVRDGTDAFLEYWDRGFSQRAPGKTISFAQLCALSAQEPKLKNGSSGKGA